MPVARILVDTGVLFAAVASTDGYHDTCAPLVRAAPKPLITTQAVMAEFFWLIGTNRHNLRNSWGFLRSGVITIAEIGDADLIHIHDLMIRYADRPMDFADATLVHVAGREGIADILTIDHDDFETYRFGRNRRFRIAPSR